MSVSQRKTKIIKVNLTLGSKECHLKSLTSPIPLGGGLKTKKRERASTITKILTSNWHKQVSFPGLGTRLSIYNIGLTHRP